jgi:hypothetical protein
MQIDVKNLENIIIIFNICDYGIEKKTFLHSNLKKIYIEIYYDKMRQLMEHLRDLFDLEDSTSCFF